MWSSALGLLVLVLHLSDELGPLNVAVTVCVEAVHQSVQVHIIESDLETAFVELLEVRWGHLAGAGLVVFGELLLEPRELVGLEIAQHADPDHIVVGRPSRRHRNESLRVPPYSHADGAAQDPIQDQPDDHSGGDPEHPGGHRDVVPLELHFEAGVARVGVLQVREVAVDGALGVELVVARNGQPTALKRRLECADGLGVLRDLRLPLSQQQLCPLGSI
mmetsp:Transcript_25546/g.43521  ORF Transcript_25546/g.43521 Transcript_25546/m.43521 type:complete len:219 (-) Transcript_25546:2786-3442(-)